MTADLRSSRRSAKRVGAGPSAFARIDWRLVCFVQLRVVLFVGSGLLISLGWIALAFLALGGFTLDGLMGQLSNLSSRYVIADAGRRHQFALLLGSAQLLVFTAVAVLRLPRLARDLRRERRS